MTTCPSGHGAICLPSWRKTEKGRRSPEFLLSGALQDREKQGTAVARFWGLPFLPGVSHLLCRVAPATCPQQLPAIDCQVRAGVGWGSLWFLLS